MYRVQRRRRRRSTEIDRPSSACHAKTIVTGLVKASILLPKELLRSIGFAPAVPKPSLTRRQHAILDRFIHEEKFAHPDTGVTVDVHHALTDNPWRAGKSFEELWRGRQYVRVGGVELAIPGDADLIHYLGAHAASHAWSRWKWIGDLFVLCRKGTANLPLQRGAALNRGRARLFDSSLLITSAVTGWDLPPDPGESCRGNRSAMRLAQSALEFSARPISPGETENWFYRLRVQIFRLRLGKQPRQLAHEITSWMHCPADWYQLRLSDTLLPAYYFLRPFLFIRRRLAERVKPHQIKPFAK